MKKDIKLSICMITYNHAEFIEEAIRSVLMQSVNFPCELVIGEDNSTDETPQKIKQFRDTKNIKIKTRFNSSNLGMQKNFEKTFFECQGKYIALIEGDDYWTDPQKLQKQVDFLEHNQDFSICYHKVNILRNNKIVTDDLTIEAPEVSTIRDLAKGNFMHTCSVVFRAGLFNEFPKSLFSSPVVDYFLHMLNAQFGKIKRLPDIMAVYRIHDDGIWSHQRNIDLKILNYLDSMIGCFPDDINQILKNRYQKIAFKSFYNRIHEDNFKERLERCTKYGTDQIIADFQNIINWDRQSKKSLFLKFLRKIYNQNN